MPKPTEAADVRIAYAGAVFVLEPHSAAGRQWMEATVEDSTGLPAVRLPLAMLDEVLRLAGRARLRLDVPWDD
jgi:hypothetical protein